MFGLTPIQWIVLIVAALNVGFAKTGLQGATMPAVILMASVFGGQLSSAIMLVMLIIGDMFAIRQYGRNISVKKILKLMPATVTGVIVGTFVGNVINDQQFKSLMAVMVIISLILLIFQGLNKSSIQVQENRLVSNLAGVLSGASSMIGNVAGPIFNVYILTRNLRKEEMVSSIAWFFVFLNLIKLPFHIFAWHTFSSNTVILGLLMIPVVYLGSRIGIKLIAAINEKTYRNLMILVTAVAAINIII